jgi:cell division protein FtsZ
MGRPSSLLVGVGGAGCNAVAVSEMDRFGLISDRDCEHHRMDVVRISPGELDMFRSTAPHFLTKDLPVVRALLQRIDEKDIIFIFTGLGGETGSHAAPVLANISRRHAKLVVSIVCTPFSVEGRDRHKHASEGLTKLSLTSDICVVLNNDGLAKAAPQMQFRKAFRVMDQVMNFVPNEMHQTLTKESMAEIKEHFRDCRQCRLGVGMGQGVFADRTALQEAFESPWFDTKLEDVPSCLALIATGNGQEYLIEPILKDLSNRVPSASVLYAVRSDPAMGDRVQVTILIGMK